MRAISQLHFLLNWLQAQTDDDDMDGDVTVVLDTAPTFMEEFFAEVRRSYSLLFFFYFNTLRFFYCFFSCVFFSCKDFYGKFIIRHMCIAHT